MTVIDWVYHATDSATRHLPQSRKDIEGDIKKYEHVIADLKAHLNAFTTICSLPPELLAEILVRRMMDDWCSSEPCTLPHLRWIRLTHVCRHFRAVAQNTPRFWSHLPLAKNDTFSELLLRSKGAPLHIDAVIVQGRRAAADICLALDAVLQNSHRLKELCMEGATVADIQLFCIKTVSCLDTLETLKLTSENKRSIRPWSPPRRVPPAAVPIIAYSATAPLRLRYLELRLIPFRWDDLVFSSPALTTLVIVGRRNRGAPGSRMPDTGSFGELFSALGAVAPRLQRLVIEDALPSGELAISADVVYLPPVSHAIRFPSLRSVHLAGDALYVAHLLNHMFAPSAEELDVSVRDQLGSGLLMQSIAAYTHNKPPLRLLYIVGCNDELWLHGRTAVPSGYHDVQDALPFKVNFGVFPQGTPFGLVLQHSGTLFAHVETLHLSGGLGMQHPWAGAFASFPRVSRLCVDMHPQGNFFGALMALPRDGLRPAPPLPSLRGLYLRGFWCRNTWDGKTPFQRLLDWAMFRCNCDAPVDEVRLDKCRYASGELIAKLEEVVVDVQWEEEKEEAACTYPGEGRRIEEHSEADL